jgi:hypothetical protein
MLMHRQELEDNVPSDATQLLPATLIHPISTYLEGTMCECKLCTAFWEAMRMTERGERNPVPSDMLHSQWYMQATQLINSPIEATA